MGLNVTLQDVATALERGEFWPALQPIVHLPSKQIVAYEMLARWKSPILGDIPPGVFIPLITSSQQLNALLEQLLRKVMECMVDWSPHVKLAINIAPSQLENTWLMESFQALLDDFCLIGDQFKFELTETESDVNYESIKRNMHDMAKRGVTFSLDDFGTGYSSIKRLRTLLFDEIKIDASLIADVDNDEKNSAIVASIIALGNALHLHSVAEGIETEAQLQKVMKLGCEYGQGYFLGSPANLSNMYSKQRIESERATMHCFKCHIQRNSGLC